MLGFFLLLALGAIVFVLLMSVHTVSALTRPPRRTYAWALARNVPGDPGELDDPHSFEETGFMTRLGTLAAWRVQGRDPSAPRIVIIHGWASGKVSALVRIPTLAKHASEVIVFDLPGHGDTEGRCLLGTQEHTMIRDALAALEPRETVLYGWSMGAGIALRVAKDAASEHNIVATICESPYVVARTPAVNVIRMRAMPYRLNLPIALAWIGVRNGIGLSWRGFNRTEIARSIQTPILIVHGQDDEVCPVDDARAIAQAARGATLRVIEQAGHNNLWTDTEITPRVTQEVAEFLESLAQPAADSAPTA